MKVEVLTQLNAKQIDKTFTYLVPSQFEDKIKVGIRVLVPFSKKEVEGIVLKIHNESIEYKCKNIIDVIDEEPILTSEMLSLGKYVSKKTMCTLISAYQAMLPKALKVGSRVNKKYDTYVSIINEDYKCTSFKQKEILDKLKNNKLLKKELTDISLSSYKTLLKNNVIKEELVEVYRFKPTEFEKTNKVSLTMEQKNAIKEIKLNEFKPYLLHGVTGSGKTEVYMNLIEKVLKENKQAIVLVPEISLTPQLTSRFKNRFSNVAILHSGLSAGEKYDE